MDRNLIMTVQKPNNDGDGKFFPANVVGEMAECFCSLGIKFGIRLIIVVSKS